MNIQPFIILLVLSGTLLLVAGIVAFIRRQRRRRQMGSVQMIRHLEMFRYDSPCFYRIVNFIQEKKEANRLIRHDDVQSALQILEKKGEERAEKPTDSKSSLLNLSTSPKTLDREIRAAMTTILRVVYYDEELRRNLPADLEQEMDQYLDHLTGN